MDLLKEIRPNTPRSRAVWGIILGLRGESLVSQPYNNFLSLFFIYQLLNKGMTLEANSRVEGTQFPQRKLQAIVCLSRGLTFQPSYRLVPSHNYNLSETFHLNKHNNYWFELRSEMWHSQHKIVKHIHAFVLKVDL